MRLGIVGSGGIVHAALNTLQNSEIEVAALWCRNAGKGKVIAESYAIANLYADYDAFLQDDRFDTVYIGLINSLHYAYAKKAIAAGKNVIVEKPFTVTSNEARELTLLAKEKSVFLFEAIMSRYSQNYEAIRSALQSIGDIKLVQCNYSQYSSRYDAYKSGTVLPAFDPQYAGGALYDINVYNVHFVEGLFGKPVDVKYFANIGFNGIDTSGVALMQYDHFQAVCCGAKDSASKSGITIQGTDGCIVMDSRPGVIKNITLYKNDGMEERIDTCIEENPMLQEFNKISAMIAQDDYEQMQAWALDSVRVMEVLEKARRDANIVFSE